MREILLRYWSIYGGWKAIFKSGYFWIAVLLSLAMYSQWACSKDWWEDILSIMPNMLGFSLGGYAMWLSIGDDDFRALISGQDEDGAPSPYMEVNAAFVHFIMLQIIAIIGALLVQAFYKPIAEELSTNTVLCEVAFEYYLLAAWYWFTYLIFIYAIMSAMAATFSLLRVSSWYDIHQTEKMKKKNQKDKT